MAKPDRPDERGSLLLSSLSIVSFGKLGKFIGFNQCGGHCPSRDNDNRPARWTARQRRTRKCKHQTKDPNLLFSSFHISQGKIGKQANEIHATVHTTNRQQVDDMTQMLEKTVVSLFFFFPVLLSSLSSWQKIKSQRISKKARARAPISRHKNVQNLFHPEWKTKKLHVSCSEFN